eukprot:SAG11_NODE_10726_length_809_cov_1.657746_1_plen_138_part_00
MPEPKNGTCIHYGKAGVRMVGGHNGSATATFVGASRLQAGRPTNPPPPQACVSAQNNDIKWPKWSADHDVGVNFDLCNITLKPDIKKARCDFWHATVDKYWEAEQWIPSANEHRDKIIEVFKAHVAARKAARKRRLA